MTQIGEAVFVPEPEPAEEPVDEKEPVNVRIVLFFDGTLNNRINIEEREKDSEVYKKNKSDDANSYDNGYTNIAIMEKHVKLKAEGYDFVAKEYIEGQGTINLKKDKTLGYAMGGGESGVVDRARKGVLKAVNHIVNADEIDSDEHYIKKLTLDVFGFSRGAATARYAIHLLLKDKLGLIYRRLQNFGYTISKSAVEVCFAGIYDTVLSYYGSHYFPWTSNKLNQKSVALAKNVLHLVAADEHRKDFPLHNINGAKNSGGREYYLPGVHSDIGGSYNTVSELALEKEMDESKKQYTSLGSEDMVINKGKKKEIETDRQNLIDLGWYDPDEISIEVKYRPTSFHSPRKIPYSILSVKRDNIQSAYCNIPLKIMADYATNGFVKLLISPKLYRRANKVLSKHPDLLKLESRINYYVTISGRKNSKAEDWLNDPTIKPYRNRHFHFSSKVGIGYSARFSKGKRKRYVYDA